MCVHTHMCTCVCVHTRVHVSVARETLSSAVRFSRTSSESSRQGFQKRLLICWEGGLLSSGAAGCGRSDTKFYAPPIWWLLWLAGRIPHGPAAGSGQATLARHDPQTGLCSANQPSVAGSALNAKSAPRAEAKRAQSPTSDLPGTVSCLDLTFSCTSRSLRFLLSDPPVPGPSGGWNRR